MEKGERNIQVFRPSHGEDVSVRNDEIIQTKKVPINALLLPFQKKNPPVVLSPLHPSIRDKVAPDSYLPPFKPTGHKTQKYLIIHIHIHRYRYRYIYLPQNPVSENNQSLVFSSFFLLLVE